MTLHRKNSHDSADSRQRTSTQLSDSPDWLTTRAISEPGARKILANPRLRTALLVLMAVVYVLNVTPHWWVGKDGALYLMLARNLASGDGYTLCGITNTHVPPGFPFILAALMKLGISSFLALNIVMGVIGLAMVAVSYLLCRTLVHRDWAILIAVLVGLSNELVQRSGEILSDTPFMLLVLVGLWLFRLGRSDGPRGWGVWIIAAALLIAGCWVRLAGVPLAIGAAIGLAVGNWRTARVRSVVLSLVTIAGIALTMGLLLYFYRTYTDPTAATYQKQISGMRDGAGMIGHVFENLLFASGQYCRLLTTQRLPAWLSFILLVVPTAAGMVWRLRRGDCAVVLAVAFYIGGLLVGATWLRTRYLLPVMPLLVLFLFEGYLLTIRLLSSVVKPIGRKQVKVAFGTIIVLTVLMLGINMVLVGRLIIGKHQSDYARTQQGGKWESLQPTVEFLSSSDESGAVLGNYAYGYLAGRQVPSLSRRLRFSQPSESQLRELLQRWNVRFAVFDKRGELRPFHLALEKYLAHFGPAAFVSGEVETYLVPLELPADDTQPSSRPTEEKQTQP